MAIKGLMKGIPKYFQQNFVGHITNYAIEEGIKGRDIPIIFSPESLSDGIQSSYSQTTIPGASAPQITYTATGARTVSFSMVIPLDYLPPNSPYTNIEDYLNAFRALAYPKYLESGKVEGPKCKLVLPNIQIEGVCSSCNIDYKTDRYANDGSMSASVSLTFIEVLTDVSMVDAKWIANDKVNILGKTNMSSQTSSTSEYTESSYNSNVGETDTITLILNGKTEYSFSQAGTCDLDVAIKNGLWSDPGFNHNKYSQYSVIQRYLCVLDDHANLERIYTDENKSLRVVVNGKTYTSITTSKSGGFTVNKGQILTWLILYIPVYNGNNYDLNHVKTRQIHITMR